MSKHFGFLRHEAARTEGAAGVEMALFFVVMLALLLPMVDVAQIVFAGIRLESAVRTGAQYALSYPSDTAGIQSVVTQATTLPSDSVTASATTTCECDDVSASCASACAGTLASFVTVSATYSVPLIMGSNYMSLANPYPVTKQVVVRTE